MATLQVLTLDSRNISFLIDPEKLRLLVQSGNLAYARVFIFLRTAVLTRFGWRIENCTDGGELLDLDQHEKVYNELNQAIIDITQQASELKSFV
jgi:hypothetical protein